MKEYVGFIVYANYMVEGDRPYVALYGRLENGESFKALKYYEPYFYIKRTEKERAQALIDATFVPSQKKDFQENDMVKVVERLPSDVKKHRDVLEDNDIECYEADIKFENRFLIDSGIKGYVSISGNPYGTKRIDNVFINPNIEPAEGEIELRILSMDIETNEKGFGEFSMPIYSVSLYGKGIKEVLILEKCCGSATTFPTEKDLLSALKERIIGYDPDVIVGWNIVDFDLVYLKKRFEANNMPFDICRTESEVCLISQSSFIRASRARVEGRMVLDAMHMLRDFFYKFEDYRLDTAGKVLLDEGKQVLERPISELYEYEPDVLSKYNLKDSYLVYRIVEKEGLVRLAMTLSSITGMMLDRVKASIATLDSLYVRMASEEGIVCPSVKGGKRIAVVGGFVEEPVYGIYENVILCDFRSLYPSIIASFNIDPLTYKKGNICAPNGACFGGGRSIMPRIILDLLEERKNARENGEHTKQFAIKIIMNSIFGVLGNPNCRFYNSEIANAVTSLGRHILKETSQKIESLGYKVIYGDTDSVFVVSGKDGMTEARDDGHRIQQVINEFYRDFIKDNYDRESYILLEFEKVFEKFFLPRQRHLEKGAKKRYAGMVDGELQIIGLEYVRRDWTQLAKDFQFNLLKKLFSKEDFESYIRQYVIDVKSGRLDEKLIYKKRLRKDIEKYTKTTPPHVKAAKLIDHRGKDNASLIEYVMTKKGPQPLELAKNIDYSHYIDKQIRPIASSVLSLLGKNFDDILSKTEQKKLSDYF